MANQWPGNFPDAGTLNNTDYVPIARPGSPGTSLRKRFDGFKSEVISGLLTADGRVGLKIHNAGAPSSPWTPPVAQGAILQASFSATATINAPGSGLGSGEVKKTLELTNSGSGAIAITFTGFAAYDGVPPPLALGASETARFVIRTVDGGANWYVSGDPSYASWSEKVSPASADLLLIADSADGNKLKRVQLANLPVGNLPGTSGGPALAADQYAAKNHANNALEARSDKRVAQFAAPITANGTYPIALWSNVPTTLSRVSFRSKAGACSIQVNKNGRAINGFPSAQAVSPTVSHTVSAESLAENDVLELVVTAASSLQDLYVTFKGNRTGD